MIYAEIKTQEEQERLDASLKASKDKKWYRRLKVVAISAKKYTVNQLSEMFNLCRATIRSYIKSYNEGGLDELTPGKSTGRPAKIAHWTKEDWDKVLERTPNQYEKLSTHSRQWTLELLGRYLKEYHQIDVCIASIYSSLRKTGRRTGRSKLRVGSPDPDYTAKREHTEAVKSLAYEGQLTSADIELIVPDKQLIRLGYPEISIPSCPGRLFFFDEANVSWCPNTGRVYRVAGEEAKIDSPGKNKTKYILGSLEYPTGEGLYEIYPHKTNAEVGAHWQHLLDMYPDDFLFVVRDNAPSHTTPKLDKFLIDNSDRLFFCGVANFSLRFLTPVA